MEARASVSGLAEATSVDGVKGLAAGQEVTGVGRCLGPSEGRGGNGVLGHGVEAGIFPRVEFWRVSQTGHLPGFRGPPKTAKRIFIDTAASRRRLRLEERTSTVG